MEKYKLTERGLFWLKVATIDATGQDKLLHDEKIKLFDENIEEWIVTDWDVDSLLKIESPKDFLNRLEDYMDYIQGRPVNNIHYVDCSNQALQLYAITTQCLKTAKICNLSGDNTQRFDGYQMLADALNSNFDIPFISRGTAKKPLMTTLYGKQKAWVSMEKELKDNIEDFSPEDFDNVFQEALMQIAPNAMTTMAQIQSLNSENIGTYYWTLPDGFKVKYDVSTEVSIEAERKSVKGTRFHFEGTSTVYAPDRWNAGMAPNVIHSIDGYIARRLINEFPEYIHTIHDAYGCHYNYIDDLIVLWKKIMCEILDSNILEDIMTEIANGRKFVRPKKRGTLTKEHILNSEYALA